MTSDARSGIAVRHVARHVRGLDAAFLDVFPPLLELPRRGFGRVGGLFPNCVILSDERTDRPGGHEGFPQPSHGRGADFGGPLADSFERCIRFLRSLPDTENCRCSAEDQRNQIPTSGVHAA